MTDEPTQNRKAAADEPLRTGEAYGLSGAVHGHLAAEAAELRSFAGWLLLSFGAWAILFGYYVMRGGDGR